MVFFKPTIQYLNMQGVLHMTGGYMLYSTTTFKYAFDYKPSDIYRYAGDHVRFFTVHAYLHRSCMQMVCRPWSSKQWGSCRQLGKWGEDRGREIIPNGMPCNRSFADTMILIPRGGDAATFSSGDKNWGFQEEVMQFGDSKRTGFSKRRGFARDRREGRARLEELCAWFVKRDFP